MTNAPAIRPLVEADIPVLADVLARAYATSQRFDVSLRAYARMKRGATFVAELGGIPVGMVVGNDYGPLAYVSQMGVDPHFQRRGIGTQLMDGLSAWLDRCGFTGTELDATPAGAPLYRRYGFVDAGETVVYGGGSPASRPRRTVRSYVPADRGALFAVDAAAFGADRSDALALLFDRLSPNVVSVVDLDGRPAGYAVAQLRAARLGPIVAPTADAAADLLDAAHAHFAGNYQLQVPAENMSMRELLAARGYRPQRRLVHMLRGDRPAAARERLYARINLGQG